MEKLTTTEIEQRLVNIPGWKYTDNLIEKTFTFTNFKEAFAMMTRIAFECEAQNHHPDWSNVYKTVHIALNTHDAGGVTEKDFSLANAIEKIVTENK
ncbi:4a-hydroxytetrahydrobiopterin dehydratase [Aurantibacter crassamenti]|uniref:4a-hydroxytetrahydrobiopterin dehydratase n=1 Tax=Aurantibacter crassamenti TaxID=1837375 RepID=UPI00193A56B2|nr:4a-hydroxytetrahydrobiopterin dehydratase [Aurantibacter crassamenti]MBM1107836.1 4a-hydroxytetrahydrobiopterin dehydratase [Aurantibacter crassamenti]